MLRKILPIMLCAISSVCLNAQNASTSQKSGDELTLYMGTYTQKESKGVYTFAFNQNTGEWLALSATEIGNPSYLVHNKAVTNMYVIGEFGEGKAGVTAYKVDNKSGEMTFLNKRPDIGHGPCYVSVVHDMVIVGNYGSGDIACYKIQSDGSLGEGSAVEILDRPAADAYRIHAVVPSPDERFLFATDLGANCVYSFKLQEGSAPVYQGRLDLPQGCGPRHMVFSVDGKFAYLVTEKSDEVMTLSYDAEKGELKILQILKMQEIDAHGGGDIRVSPDGRFVYASDRLVNDGIAIFEVQNDGVLMRIGYQPTLIHPRNFAITPNGRYLLAACRDGNAVQVFERNAHTGLLNEVNRIPCPEVVCVKMQQR